VTLSFLDDAGDKLVGAKGTVSHEEVIFFKMLEELWCDACIVLPRPTWVAGNEASVTEVHQSDKAHFRLSATGLLAVVLGESFLIFSSVIKVDAGAINRFEHVSPPEITLRDCSLKGVLDTGVDLF